jgi:hypothetical protein
MRSEWVDALSTAAQLSVCGFDPLHFLYSKDAFEINLMIEIAKRADQFRNMLEKRLANEIANAVGKMLGG